MTAHAHQPPRRMTPAARERIRQELASGSDETNPEFLLSTASTSLVLAMADGLLDPVHLARAALANRGLDADGYWVGFPRAREIHLSAPAADSVDTAAEQAVANIARRILHLNDLATHNNDALDFHNVATWTIRDALMAAYAAGARAAAAGQED